MLRQGNYLDAQRNGGDQPGCLQLGRANLRQGDRVLLTEMEHHANLVPWQILAAEKGIELDFVRVADNGTLILDELPELLTARTKLFGFTAASNVLGTLNPVKQLTDAAHKVGALVLLDACQSVPHMPVDVQALDIDFAAFSGHKMLGPTGSGALWGRARFSMPCRRLWAGAT